MGWQLRLLQVHNFHFFRPMRVLLIEPDRLLADQYVSALEGVGDCTVVYDAQSAISTIDESPPDIIVLELLLNSHNGIEFLYELRSYSDLHAIPIILHTYVRHEDVSSDESLLYELGVKDYLYKPEVSLAQLASSVSRVVDSKKVA